MKKLLYLALFCALSLISRGQTLVGNQVPIKLFTDAPGHTQFALASLPDDYDKTTTTYPLIMFFHGLGQVGSTQADLSKLNGDGLPALISKGLKVQAINPVDKKLYKFIVVSPQNSCCGTGPSQANYMLSQLISLGYRIDTTRIYITGLSAGGWSTMEMPLYSQAAAKRIAAIVPMSVAPIDTLYLKSFSNLKGTNLQSWFFCGNSDGFLAYEKQYNDSINKYSGGGSKITTYNGGHCCWQSIYDTAYRQNGMNIYEWMLQYKTTAIISTGPVGTSPIIIPPPVIVTPPTTTPIKVDTSNGNVAYKYYEGAFTTLPDFTKLTAKKSSTVKNINLAVADIKTNFALIYEGYLKIDTTGSYIFGTSSDDGSALYIDDTLRVNNDGLHSNTYVESKFNITKGVHKFSLRYFQSGGDIICQLYWTPLGKTKALIPDVAFVPKPIITPSTPKIVGTLYLFDVKCILYDDMTWEYQQIMN